MRRGYAFSGSWTVDAQVRRVHEVLVDLEHYPEWWRQVRAVASLGENDARMLYRSALPYTLDLVLHAVHRKPELLQVRIRGDLEDTAV